MALDDRSLERLPAKLRNLQPNLSGLGVQIPLAMAGSGIAISLAALVALGITQPIQQGVQSLYHRTPYDPVEGRGGS
jgi:hypothetical protein